MSITSAITSPITSLMNREAKASASSGKSADFASALRKASENAEAPKAENAMEKLSEQAQSQLSEFRRELTQLFGNNSIDTSTEVRLESDGKGGIRVGAEHPQAEEISKLLQENPDLLEKFKKLGDAYTRLRGSNSGSSPQAFSIGIVDGDVHVSMA